MLTNLLSLLHNQQAHLVEQNHSVIQRSTYRQLFSHFGDHGFQVLRQRDGWLVRVQEEVRWATGQQPQGFPLEVLVVDVSVKEKMSMQITYHRLCNMQRCKTTELTNWPTTDVINSYLVAFLVTFVPFCQSESHTTAENINQTWTALN